jgi:hypothetical protein
MMLPRHGSDATADSCGSSLIKVPPPIVRVEPPIAKVPSPAVRVPPSTIRVPPLTAKVSSLAVRVLPLTIRVLLSSSTVYGSSCQPHKILPLEYCLLHRLMRPIHQSWGYNMYSYIFHIMKYYLCCICFILVQTTSLTSAICFILVQTTSLTSAMKDFVWLG